MIIFDIWSENQSYMGTCSLKKEKSGIIKFRWNDKNWQVTIAKNYAEILSLWKHQGYTVYIKAL